MGRIKLWGVALLVAAVMLAGTGGPASAQGYEGWIWHPYPNVGWWWCGWYSSEYWCEAPNLSRGERGWFRANLNWYDLAYAEMQRVGLA